MIDQNEVTMMIRYKENTIQRKPKNDTSGHTPFENLFSDKYFIYNYSIPNYGDSYYMHIYDSQTLQLNQIIPLFYFMDKNRQVKVSVDSSTIVVVAATNIDRQVKLKLLE